MLFLDGQKFISVLSVVVVSLPERTAQGERETQRDKLFKMLMLISIRKRTGTGQQYERLHWETKNTAHLN